MAMLSLVSETVIQCPRDQRSAQYVGFGPPDSARIAHPGCRAETRNHGVTYSVFVCAQPERIQLDPRNASTRRYPPVRTTTLPTLLATSEPRDECMEPFTQPVPEYGHEPIFSFELL